MIGSQRALDTLAPKTAVTKRITKDIDQLIDFMDCQLKKMDIVVMVSGDPGFYSLLTALKSHFSPEQLRVIPGISSVQAAFSKIGEVWQDANLISMHGRTVDAKQLSYTPGKKLGILTDEKHNPNYISQQLLENGWPANSRVWLCAELSYDTERIIQLTLATALTISNFEHCVMVVTE